MKKYEILSHIADLKIKVFGKTKEELFSNALLGMSDALQAEIKKGSLTSKQKEIKRDIKIQSPDLGMLLVDFLGEVLYLTQVNKEIYTKVKFKPLTSLTSVNQIELECELFGQKVERFGEDIKAVTYHDLDVRRKKDNIWEAIILFDI